VTGDPGKLAGDVDGAFVWGDFHRVFLGRGARDDIVQCHLCELLIPDADRAGHLADHRAATS
jgi:hypothetical protein